MGSSQGNGCTRLLGCLLIAVGFKLSKLKTLWSLHSQLTQPNQLQATLLPTASAMTYDSLFAFLQLHSSSSPAGGQRFCVNFQNLHTIDLPPSAEEATPLSIAWWGSSKSPSSTNICEGPAPAEVKFGPGKVVPLDYRTTDSCGGRFNHTTSNASRQTLKQMLLAEDGRRADARVAANMSIITNELLFAEHNHSLATVLFLVKEGQTNVGGTRDFLYSQFYNPAINESLVKANVFYIYESLFGEDIKVLGMFMGVWAMTGTDSLISALPPLGPLRPAALLPTPLVVPLRSGRRHPGPLAPRPHLRGRRRLLGWAHG